MVLQMPKIGLGGDLRLLLYVPSLNDGIQDLSHDAAGLGRILNLGYCVCKLPMLSDREGPVRSAKQCDASHSNALQCNATAHSQHHLVTR